MEIVTSAFLRKLQTIVLCIFQCCNRTKEDIARILIPAVLYCILGCYQKISGEVGRDTPSNNQPITGNPVQQLPPSNVPGSVPETPGKGKSLEVALSNPRTSELQAIGYAEGTWTINGTPTDAYNGHFDSGVPNYGLFSCIVCGGRKGLDADNFFLSQHDIWPGFTLKRSASLYLGSVKKFGLPSDHPMLIGAFLLLATQSPEATFARKGLLDSRFQKLSAGITCANIVEVLVDSFRDPNNDSRILSKFSESDLRHDQKRRVSAYQDFMNKKSANFLSGISSAECK